MGLNKKGNAIVNIFLFMVVSLIIVFISVVFVYMGNLVKDELHESLDNNTVLNDSSNVSAVIDDNFGAVTGAYGSLYWISIFLIVGMVIAIFIHSYLITYKPVMFIPYIFVCIIAVVVAVGISNGYETIIADDTLANTFEGFLGANFILLNLPLWVAVISIIGGVIMVIRMKQAQSTGFYY